eukprot:scaffold36110_cov65-Phaeocystis_antarctica.AAC.2
MGYLRGSEGGATWTICFVWSRAIAIARIGEHRHIVRSVPGTSGRPCLSNVKVASGAVIALARQRLGSEVLRRGAVLRRASQP